MAKKPQFGSIRQRGRIWWIRYYRDGRRFDESSKSEKYEDAERMLKQRHAEMFAGTHIDPRIGKTRVAEVLDDLLLDYKTNQKGYVWAETIVRLHLKPFFEHMKVASVTRAAIQRYVAQRQTTKPENDSAPTNATINRETAILHRALVLARDGGKLGTVPVFPKKLRENNVRKGFFEHDAFLAMRAELPAHIKPVVTFGYWTGCRKEEILSLRWSQVDLVNRVVRLEPGETKNDEPRVIPMAEELYQILAMQKAVRDAKWPACAWVFFRDGERIRGFRKAWDSACKRAGLVDDNQEPTRLFHDLRRTGVRNLVRAGVPERVAMRISGHKTRAVFDRYNIVSERDLREAAMRLDRYITEQKTAQQGQNGDNRPERKNTNAS